MELSSFKKIILLILRRNGMLEQPLLFNGCSSIQFFNLPPFHESSRLVASTSLWSLFVTYGTLCHAIGHQVLPTQPLPRETEVFPRGGKYFNRTPLFT